MTGALKTACNDPTCPEIVEGAYCHRHGKRNRERRKPAHQRGYDSTWRKISQAHKQREPRCRECRRRDLDTPVQEVDHVIPHRLNQTLLHSGWNLQSLCKSCHRRKTSREGDRWVQRRWPLVQEVNRPVTVVTGPPGSGKTTYIEQHRTDGDDVVDLIDLRRESEGKSTIHLLGRRNEKIRELAAQDTEGTLWVELMAKRLAYRRFWQWNLNAEAETLVPDEDICRDRIKKRGRNVDQLLDATTEWYSYYRLEGQ